MLTSTVMLQDVSSLLVSTEAANHPEIQRPVAPPAVTSDARSFADAVDAHAA